MEYEKRYRGLNNRQKQAVDTIDGPLMVIAGPGTGKTELLSVRTATILAKTDTLPENILCLTFTDSGASAMRERLVEIIGKDAYKVAVHTFHSFGTEIINQNREFFYNGALFQPADDLSRYEILRSIFDELDYKNPLASTMNGEYTHQPDATKVISELKRSGLTSDELLAVIEQSETAIDESEHILVPLISSTVSAKMRDQLAIALPQLQTLSDNAETLYEITPLIRIITDGLDAALTQSQTDHPTKPITAWKKKWFVKDAKGELCFKSRGYLAKLRALAFVYYEYINRMEAAGLYDYDDMILQVVHAMDAYPDLKFNLQEKYLYIMVDEFQDTNLAQMRILHSLTDSVLNEGKPNIMVVGDDDQAVYSFQGADISNILRFKEIYPSAELVVLTDNYRSKSEIIAGSRDIIVQGSDRLESRIEDINKQLTAQKKDGGTIDLFHAPTIDSERHWLVDQVAHAVASGTKPQDIAVLTRRHFEIQSLLPYFSKKGIAVRYERQDNVLDQPPIKALELVSKVVIALSKGQHDTANALMPELLSHPAWEIKPNDLWLLSTKAYDSRQRWLDVMATMPQFVSIHSWLIEQSANAAHTPLEPMIDHLIGRSQESNTTSPFFEYYFSGKQLEDTPSQYLDCLAALRTIRAHLREYHAKQGLTLEAFMEFIQLHRRLGTNLMVTTKPLEKDENAINVMTAHKSKGLEFDTVFIFNAVDTMWGEKARSASRNINYPENLPLAPAGESSDERLRLFYVAMTRAKNHLVISFSDSNDSDKSTLLASFLAGNDLSENHIPAITDGDVVESAELAWYEPLTAPTTDLKKILEPQLQKYKLSATHLNAFLDVSRGGPRTFLLDNLLHFPSAKSASASYGSAIHNTLQQAHVHLTATGERKPIEDVLRDFETNLHNERLSPPDLTTYLQKGSEQLQAFLKISYDTFAPKQKAELSFASQDSFIGDAHLTGSLDVVDINKDEKTIIVTDYKTGKSAIDWKGKDDHEKVKLHKYRQQLLFYKLLVEHSRDYSSYEVVEGRLAFIEPTKAGDIVALDTSFSADEIKRFSTLVEKVWSKIMALDLPDTSQYEQNARGIAAFEQDLIDGNI